MKKRSPILVFFLPIITLGVYQFFWFVKTKGEMNSLGAQIPTAWLIIIPFVNIYWLWKYCKGVKFITKGNLSAGAAFCLFFLGPVGAAIIQSKFNALSAS